MCVTVDEATAAGINVLLGLASAWLVNCVALIMRCFFWEKMYD